MKTKAILLITAILLSFSSPSQSVDDYRKFRVLFNDGKYNDLYEQAMDLRQKQFGKNWRTDYFISIALCAGGESEKAMRAFNYTLKAYKRDLSDDMFDFVLHERDLCSSGSSTSNIPPDAVAAAISTIDNESNAGVRGKMGYIFDCKTDPHDFSVDSDFDQKSVAERIFDVENIDEALDFYRNFLGSAYTIENKGRFIVVTPGTNAISTNELNSITSELEQVYNFYAESFDLRKPNKLITVYLMNNRYNLRKIAKKIHGLNIPDSNIGYSCLTDLSVLGTSSTASIGTIKHELFHLMIRGDVGDIPSWLDEAIACVYETSYWEGNELKGSIWQWRSEFMINMIMPRLSYIIQKDHEAYYPNEALDNCEMALNYATAKHFGLFLQEKDMLQKTISAFKNRENVLTGNDFTDESDFDVLEQVFQQPIEDIMKDFDSWIKYHLNRTFVNRNWNSVSEILTEMHPCTDELIEELNDIEKSITDKENHTFTDEELTRINRMLLDTRFECYH